MPDPSSQIPFAPSNRSAPVGTPSGAPEPSTALTVTLYLRGIDPAASGPTLSREQYATSHGASAADIAAVRDFAATNGLTVVAVDPGRRSVEISGTLAALATAFSTELAQYDAGDGTVFRGRSGVLSIPAELDGVVTGIFGLDNRAQARTQLRPGSASAVQYTPPEVAAAYQYPSGATGAGECVALIELGGGFRQTDLSAYFASLGLAPPTVIAVGVDGGANTPGTANGPDGEVMLDIEVVGSIAPGAKIAVYFAPNTDQGFIDAVTTAIHDTTNAPSVVSISWGGAESTWTAQAMNTMEQAFAAAAAMGVTVTVAAGDNGSSDGVTDGLAHVDFPASAPHALACGGTTLTITNGAVAAETVWNDGATGGSTGGGISTVFALPSYQQDAGVPPSANPGGVAGRGVPDVAGDADPETGYTVEVDGETIPVGGTSAVAPLWAALVALLNESLGRPVGFLQPFLYSAAGVATVRDVTTGSNGAYTAGPGWDACTGLGSPEGSALLSVLGAASTA